ncbi:MAG: phosphogluconate dehydratase [Oxalobacteraceae bacterium]|nr:MAG: phosphogluconate dehydratase [Oxalobacteraceae bacterium]
MEALLDTSHDLTVQDLIAEYLISASFRRLSASTQTEYRRVVHYIEADTGALSAAQLKRPLIRRLRDREHGAPVEMIGMLYSTVRWCSELYAQGKLSREELLEAESRSYHSAGTCTFYGTANSNQMLMEVMGLHLPGAAFITPGTPLRDALTAAAAQRAVQITDQSGDYLPVGHVVDEKAIVNAIVALLTTGGSTNHTMHLVAIARAAGIVIDWNDFNDLSAVVPLLARIYPNGEADVNHFHAAGGTGFVIRELLDAGLLHEDVKTILGQGLRKHAAEPLLIDDKLVWREAPAASGDENVIRPASNPFSADGGLRLMSGNLGRAVIKVSAVKPQYRVIKAPAIVFDSQEDFLHAFSEGKLDRDFVAVVRFQGPRANGMPELHSLTPALGVLQDAGRHVALVTDGRMSGASGKVPAAIHVSPEVLAGGPLGRIRTGDMILLDAEQGVLQALVPDADWDTRSNPVPHLASNEVGHGRELFAMFRNAVSTAEEGAATFGLPPLIKRVDPEINQPGGDNDAKEFSDEDTLIKHKPQAVEKETR